MLKHLEIVRYLTSIAKTQVIYSERQTRFLLILFSRQFEHTLLHTATYRVFHFGRSIQATMDSVSFAAEGRPLLSLIVPALLTMSLTICS